MAWGAAGENVMRGRIQLLALSATIGLGVMAAPTAAGACVEAGCSPAREAKPQQPIKLEKFRRNPVALGKATRVVKTPDGDYAKVKLTRRAKVKPAAPQFLPVAVSPEAEAALAMQASVRVVEADELNEIDLTAEDLPLVPVLVTTTSEPPVRVASNIDDLDRKSEETTAPAAVPSPATDAQPDNLKALLWRSLAWLGDVWTTMIASVRNLIG